MTDVWGLWQYLQCQVAIQLAILDVFIHVESYLALFYSQLSCLNNLGLFFCVFSAVFFSELAYYFLDDVLNNSSVHMQGHV